MFVSSKWFMNRFAYIGGHFMPMATPKICKKMFNVEDKVVYSEYES